MVIEDRLRGEDPKRLNNKKREGDDWITGKTLKKPSELPFHGSGQKTRSTFQRRTKRLKKGIVVPVMEGRTCDC